MSAQTSSDCVKLSMVSMISCVYPGCLVMIMFTSSEGSNYAQTTVSYQ